MPAFVKSTKYHTRTWDIYLITPEDYNLPPQKLFRNYKT